MTCVISFVGLLSQSFSTSLSVNKRRYRSDLAEFLGFKLSLVMPAVFVVVVVVIVGGSGGAGDGGAGGGFLLLLLFLFCFYYLCPCSKSLHCREKTFCDSCISVCTV